MNDNMEITVYAQKFSCVFAVKVNKLEIFNTEEIRRNINKIIKICEEIH